MPLGFVRLGMDSEFVATPTPNPSPQGGGESDRTERHRWGLL